MVDQAMLARQLAIEAIEGYLARHPMAADSAQGIAEWWLPSMGVDVPIEQVLEALAELGQRGSMICTRLPDGQAIYRRQPPPRSR